MTHLSTSTGDIIPAEADKREADGPNAAATIEDPQVKMGNELSNEWGIFIFVNLIALVMFTVIPSTVWYGFWPLILSLYWLTFYIFFPHRKRVSGWLITHFALLVTVFIVAILSNALWFWLLTNFYWASQDSGEQQKMAQIDNRFALEARYDPTFFGDGLLFPIYLRLNNLTDEEQSIPLTLAISPGQSPISVVGMTQPITLTLPPSEVITRSLWVQNESFSGLRQNTVLTISHASTSPLALTLPIRVETAWGYRLRTFVNSTVNQASPLILLLATLTPGIAVFIQQEINKREALVKERQKREAEILIENLQGYLSTDVEQAELALNKLKTNQYQDHAGQAIQIATGLLALTKQEGNSKTHVQIARSWPDACVACYLSARLELEEKRRKLLGNPHLDVELEALKVKLEALKEARYYLPLDQVKQPYLLDQLARIEEAGAGPVQPRRWVVPLPLTPPMPSLPPECALAPFVWDRAEDDGYYLFHPDARRTAFQGNALFRTLLYSQTNAIIWSTPGSGRTALAMALAYWSEQESALTLYSAGQMSIGQIQAIGAQRLMDFICRHPTHLTLSGETERELLANVLVTGLGKDAARSMIERTHVQLDETRWLNEELDPDRRQYWRQLAQTHLQFLDKMLSQATEQREMSRFWVNEWVACAHALWFAPVRLVVDCRMEDLNWLKEVIWPNLYEWRNLGLYVTMLVPERARPQLPPSNAVTLVKQLAWDKAQFYDLLSHRYRAFFPSRRQPLEACFLTDNLLDRLIAHCRRAGCYHPRRFNQLWSKIVGQHSINDLQISRAMIEEAARTVPW